MKRFATILIVLISGLGMKASAQNLPTEQKRLLYYDALTLLDRYESCLSMLDPGDADVFLDLFVSGNSKVYNDLLSVTDGESLSAEEYANSLRNEVMPGCRVFLKDVMHDAPISENDSIWSITISFLKEILYYDQCDIKYSSSEYFQADYKLEMTMLWNRYTREIHIGQIDGTMDSEFPRLPEDFVVLDLKSDSRYGRLLYHGNELVYNIDSIVFLANDALTDKDAFYWPDKDDIRLSVGRNLSCNRKIDVEFNWKKWRIRPYYETVINQRLKDLDEKLEAGTEFFAFVDDMGVYDIQGMEDWTFDSDGYEAGIDFGIVPLSGISAKLGIFTGIGISKTTLTGISKTAGTKLKYDYGTAQDVDGDGYKRHYEIHDIKYTLPVTDLVIPLYLDLELALSPKSALYIEAGARLYKNLERECSEFQAEYKTYGTYEQYGNLTLNEDNLKPFYGDEKFDGFVNYGILSVDNMVEKSADIPDVWFDAIGEVGLRFRFARTASFFRDLYLNLGLSYHYTVDPYEKSDMYPSGRLVEYYLDKGEQVNYTISDFMSGMTRTGSIRGKISLTYRF